MALLISTILNIKIKDFQTAFHESNLHVSSDETVGRVRNLLIFETDETTLHRILADINYLLRSLKDDLKLMDVPWERNFVAFTPGSVKKDRR